MKHRSRSLSADPNVGDPVYEHHQTSHSNNGAGKDESRSGIRDGDEAQSAPPAVARYRRRAEGARVDGRRDRPSWFVESVPPPPERQDHVDAANAAQHVDGARPGGQGTAGSWRSGGRTGPACSPRPGSPSTGGGLRHECLRKRLSHRSGMGCSSGPNALASSSSVMGRGFAGSAGTPTSADCLRGDFVSFRVKQ